MCNNNYRGRFAPSPSGEMHLGNAWTALLAWLQVRKLGGQMILRIEDLDPDRSKDIFTRQIIDDMRWMGLDWEEGPDTRGAYSPYCQSERRHLYELAIRKLQAMGYLYPCYCTRMELRSAAQAPHMGEGMPVYKGTCRYLAPDERKTKEDEGSKTSLRLQVPRAVVAFSDLCSGYYQQDIAGEIGDFIVRRADGVHAYQLAVVVDDAAMQITNVLRGADLLESTPRQLLLYQLLQLNPPRFSHVPLLVGEDGQRLSKRHGDVSIAALQRKGVSAESIVAYLAFKARLLRYRRPVNPAELVDGFELERLPQSPIIVTAEELNSLV